MSEDENPKNPSSALRDALAVIRDLEKAEGPQAAEKALIALIAENQQSHQAYMALTRLLMKQKKFDYATRAADRAVELSPMQAEPVVMAGFARMRAGDRDGAGAAFVDALRIDASSARATLGAAMLKLADESYEDALELSERAVALDPTVERAHQLIVRINMKMGNTSEALEELKTLIDAEGSGQKALRTYARLMRDEGRLDEALADAAAAAKDGKSMGRLARLASLSGKPDVAIAEYRALLEQGALRDTDRVRFVRLLIVDRAFDDARAQIAELSDRRVIKPIKHTLKGDVAMAEGSYGAAVMQYRKACKSAGIDGLDTNGLEDDANAQDTAKAWARHATQGVRQALRSKCSAG